MRVAYDNAADLRRLMPDLPDEVWLNADFGSYPISAFLDDLGELTQYRTDPDLATVLAEQSLPTLEWMRHHGVRFDPLLGSQAFQVGSKFKFWGGLAVQTSGGGPGLVGALSHRASENDVRLEYETRARELVVESGKVSGVVAERAGEASTISCDAVVIASGGFEASASMRAQYLGENWDLARVRGTPYNVGDGIGMGLRIGASPAGHWSGCHAVAWDYHAPPFGDLTPGVDYQRNSDPWGIMVNSHGRRFMDEGADFRTHTYARTGRVILQQPQQLAWQLFDAKVERFLRPEYRTKRVSVVREQSLESLAARMDNVDADELVREVIEYNKAVNSDVPFAPERKDGRKTIGLAVPKSNWANTIDQPPFTAYPVTCGITFTYGGLRIDREAKVLGDSSAPIANLYCAGEAAAGLFYFNYPSGSGLTSGAVFGRIAGANAATRD
jgi:tricarballylate dehydrogenase